MAAERDGPKKKSKKLLANELDIVKNKRKRDGEAAVPSEKAAIEEPPTAAAPKLEEAAGGPARKKQRRHKRGPAGEEQQPADPEEAARRKRQRELQERARKLRAEGKGYVAPRKGTQPPKEPQQGAAGGAKGDKGATGDQKGRNYLGDKTPGWRPFSSVEVIVLPIFWNNNKEEKTAVLTASERARDILVSAGLSADMDACNKYTPGQKMKYWETMGVRVRVELGPRDVVNGNCVVALSTKAPGEVATKNVVNMRHKMLDAVRAALEKARMGAARKLAQEELEGEEREGKKAKKAKKEQQQGKPRGSEEEEEEDQVHEEEAEEEEEEDADEEEAEEAEGGRKGASGGSGADEEEDEDEEGSVAAALAFAKSRQGGVLSRTANPEVRKLKKQRGGGGATAATAAEADGGSGDDEDQPGTTKGTTKPTPFSADALEDDFGDIVEFEAEEDKLMLSKKERVKKTTKEIKAKRKAERRAGFGGQDGEEAGAGGEGLGWGKAETARWGAAAGAKGGPKKAKVVKF